MSRIVFIIAAFATCKKNAASTDVKVSDPCLPNIYRNITHLNERYTKLGGYCPYTDSRIEHAWFYAGNDAIVTSPPDFCACGYRFPIWMRGILPTINEGVANRTVCVKFTTPCYRSLQIQLKNCGSFFVYHLSPTPDDSGYCFGINKPGQGSPAQHPEQIPNANITVQESSITSNSFKTVISVSVLSINLTVDLFHENGSLLKSVQLDKSILVYKWANLNPATNYTVQINAIVRGESRILATTWALTNPFQKPTVVIEVDQSSISTRSLSVSVKYDRGSDNITAEGAIRFQNGSLIITFKVDKPLSKHTFENLTTGTRYTVSVYVNQRTGPAVLDELWVFTKPDIQAHIEPVTARDDVNRYTTFLCVFQPSSDKFYSVLWTIKRDDKNVTIYKNSDDVHGTLDLQLTEADILKYNFYIPFNISCAVAEKDAAQPEFSVASKSLFAGIKVLTPRLTMYRNETMIIQFKQTVPSGCYKNVNGAITCNLTIAVAVPVKETCTGISTRSCTIQVHGNVNAEQSLEIQATENGQYGVLKRTTHDVILRTEPLEFSIWSNYILPAVKVTVLPEKDTYWRGKRCEALNDPHMYTFDATTYEHHMGLSDEYVLYTHTSFNAKIHHKLERCNTNAMCNCGVAVQAGRDIYLISTCNDVMEIGYKQCGDGVLLVKQETDTKYTIYLPYGTSVTARLDKTPYINSAGSMIVSVSVFPSVHDQERRSRGLCGTLDNNPSNDFHGRTGELILNRTDFIQAWRVSKDDSLFKQNVKSTLPWMSPACACSVTSGDDIATNKCRHGADDNCSSGRTVGLQTCIMAEKRNINKTGENTISALDLNIDRNHINSQNASQTQTGPTVSPETTPLSTAESEFTSTATPETQWSHNKAKEFCLGYMKSSRAFRLCARVPHTDTDRAIETCTQDVVYPLCRVISPLKMCKLTQTTQWHRISRQSMQDSCVTEIHKNKTVRESIEASRLQVSTKPKQATSTPSNDKQTDSAMATPFGTGRQDSDLSMTEIIESIEEIACPNECFGRGICQKGSCKCDFGYGSYDCSLDLSKPPSAIGLLYGSLCDEKYAPCTHMFIRGGFFASKTVRCHIVKFEILSITKGRQNMDAYVLPGQAQSLIDVICPLRPSRQVRSVPGVQDVTLISCYNVSVSNDGVHHGLPLEMCVYNSECQHITNRNDGALIAVIKVGYCFIGGECIPSGMNKTGDIRYCDPHTSLFEWTVRSRSTLEPAAISTTHTVMTQVEAESPWMIPVLVAMICVCTMSVIIVCVVCIRKRKQSENRSNNKEKEDVTIGFKPTPDFEGEIYAHINPNDISNDLPYVKTSAPGDYTHLDKTRQVMVDYDKLNTFQNNRSEKGPSLPERYGDPDANNRVSFTQQYGTYLTLAERDDKDYERLEALSSEYLRPIFKSNVNTVTVFNSDEDFPEGYERPDPWNK